MQTGAEKKTVLITGVSSGFGYLTTIRMLEGSYKIVALLRGGDARGREIFKSYSRKIESQDIAFIDCDLTDSQSLEGALVKAQELLPEGLDILINNAGYGLLGPIEIQSSEQVRLQFETNFFAPLFITQQMLPLLRKSRGRILNLSSLVGFNVFPFYGSYAASKHALDALTEGLFYDLNEFGIQVCAIEPGGFKTQFSPKVQIGSETHPSYGVYAERILKFKEFLKLVEKKLEKDPQIVVDKIIELCERSRIPVRAQVGSDSLINWIFCKIFPDQLRIKFQNWLYQKFLF